MFPWPSTALVIFGASGDLTERKLIPALYSLTYDHFLPPQFFIVGSSRSAFSDDEFREQMKTAVKEHARQPLDERSWEDFSQRLFYHPMDVTQAADFEGLKSRLEKLAAERDGAFNYLFYLATAPRFFGDIAAHLKEAGLAEKPSEETSGGSRLVVEKPFGRDLESAKKLNDMLQEHLSEKQIFRIDHYLGKETVQNILVFRFANGIFEPLWNRHYIDHIQITWAEDLGVGSRAGYFDANGILRDIVQNHLLQILSLLCIEPPQSLSSPGSIHNEKVKVLRSIRPLSKNEIKHLVVRAQYTPGQVNGSEVPAYLQEDGVAEASQTETFAALKLEIDNWRWAGVPIYIRAGKRLPRRLTEITVCFQRPPGHLFHGKEVAELEHNLLTIQVQPVEGMTLRIGSKPPGPRMRVRSVDMDFTYGESFGVSSPDAYERLILDAVKGDSTLFTRGDEIEEAWNIVHPILDCWGEENCSPLETYRAGSWGPEAARTLIRSDNRHWRP